GCARGRAAVCGAFAYWIMRRPQQPGPVLSFVCCLGLLCGSVTQWVGLTALFGFFLAGIMTGEAPALSERTRQILTQMVHAIFVPLYFAGIGLLLGFLANFDALLVGFVTVVSIGGKLFVALCSAFSTR